MNDANSQSENPMGLSATATELLRGILGEVSGVSPRPMKKLFDLAKQHQNIDERDLELLLAMEPYEYRMAAICVMDFQARSAKTTEDRLQRLYDLYLERHNRIDTWDMVDRAAPHVIGKYLFDKPRERLYQLATSGTQIEKRTAIVSTWYFLKNGQTADTFDIARILVHEHSDLVALAVGSWIREAGKRDGESLLSFLDEFAPMMHRGALRAAIEKLPNPMRQHYLGL